MISAFARTAILVFGVFCLVRPILAQQMYGPLDYFSSNEPGMRQYMAAVEKNHLDTNHMKVSIMKLIQDGNFAQATNELNYVLERIPNHPRALQISTMVSRMSKKYSLSINYFEQALRLFPRYAVTRAQYGNYLAEIGDLDAGIEQLKTAVELDPKYTAGYVVLAKVYARKGKNDLAQEAADKARELGFQGAILETSKGR